MSDFLRSDTHFRHADKVQNQSDIHRSTPMYFSPFYLVPVGDGLDLLLAYQAPRTSLYERVAVSRSVSATNCTLVFHEDIDRFRWLAHDSVEEDLSAKYGLLPWALQTRDGDLSMDLKSDFKRFLAKKNDL